MNKRFLLNFSLTIAILAVVGVSHLLLQNVLPGKESLTVPEVEQKNTVRQRVLIGDESLGVPDCVVEYDQDGFRRKMQASYPDGAQTTVVYDRFGRVKQAVEMDHNDCSQVYEFDPRTQKPKELKFLDRDGRIEKKVVFGKGWHTTSEYDTGGGLCREETLFSNGRLEGKTAIGGPYGAWIRCLRAGEHVFYSGVGNKIDQISLLHDKSSAVAITAKFLGENLVSARHYTKHGVLKSRAQIHVFHRKDGWNIGYPESGDNYDFIEVTRNQGAYPWLSCKGGAVAEEGTYKLQYEEKVITEHDYTGVPLRQYKLFSGLLTNFAANGALEKQHYNLHDQIIGTERIASNGDLIDVKPYHCFSFDPTVKKLLSLFQDSVSDYSRLRQVLPDMLQLKPAGNEFRLLKLPLTE
ncbi:MAG: hypothetical protein K2W82_10655 [Candidatus Obscuribacterales bacterium]|nr:hypothetical protein [Candidatus Obscuribacterales bacterium]